MAKECFYLGAEGDEPDKVMKGLSWLLENSRPTGGWFAVLGLDNLETISNYDPRLIILKGLAKHKDHKMIINGKVIYLITERKIPYDGESRPLLAVYPTKQYLGKLHSIRNIPKILAIEWAENELEDWKKYARAIRYGSSVVKQQETLALNKVVMVALQEMVPAINIANHMSHARNRDIVVHTFKILVKSGERFYSRDR